MTHDERDTLERGLSAFLEALARVEQRADQTYATKEAQQAMGAKVDSLIETVEGIRRDAKGANNWSRITVGLLGAVPAVFGAAKAVGLL